MVDQLGLLVGREGVEGGTREQTYWRSCFGMLLQTRNKFLGIIAETVKLMDTKSGGKKDVTGKLFITYRT